MDVQIYSDNSEQEDTVELERYDLILKVVVKKSIDDNKIHYIAANPPDYRTSYSGSGLPFANVNQAFENTINKGVLTPDSNGMAISKMRFPNLFYEVLGNKLINPHVNITYHIDEIEKELRVDVSDGLPFRSLTHPKVRTSPLFYDNEWSLPIVSQERLLRNSAYPSVNEHYVNFWGMKPSH